VVIGLDAERRSAPPMRDGYPTRPTLAGLPQLLDNVASVDRQAAGRAERFITRPGVPGNHRRFDHPRHPTSNYVD
jgi:hypothetical protein